MGNNTAGVIVTILQGSTREVQSFVEVSRNTADTLNLKVLQARHQREPMEIEVGRLLARL
jgi:hypothetical protein